MSENKKVADINGKLIPRSKAHKIDGHYYEEGVTCIKMPDGQWYRTNTNKIIKDWEKNEWVFSENVKGLIKGLVDDGSEGYFSPSENNVSIRYKKDMFVRQFKIDIFNNQNNEDFGSVKAAWATSWARNPEIAEKFGYKESYNDGKFYRLEDCSTADKEKMQQPGLPNNERTTQYSIDDRPELRKKLEESFNATEFKIEKSILKLSKLVPYSLGVEYESCIGFMPARVRNRLGVQNLRDGSISGVEYVTVPLRGAKGLQALKEICSELTKRCEIDNHCSIHMHFGNVRRDKLTILALWRLATLIQVELLGYFPYTRTHSIRPDGKVYCKHLPEVGLKTTSLFTANKEQFHKNVLIEFNKIYSFLNNEQPIGHRYDERVEKVTKVGILAGKKIKMWRPEKKIFVYSVKNKTHAIRGNKWDRPQRYYWLNFLPTFFSPAETIEFRPHEATLSFEKSAMWMLTCVAILNYAKNNVKHCLTADAISVKEVLTDSYDSKIVTHLMGYFKARENQFKDTRGNWKQNYNAVETEWTKNDKDYKFCQTSIEDLL